MEQNSFTFYRSFFEAISNLPKAADRDAAMMALCDYALNGNERQLTGNSAAVFMLVKPNLDHNRKKHENGLKGGRPKGNSEDKPNGNQAASEDEANPENSEPNVNRNETKAEPNAKQTGVGGRRQEVGVRSREVGDIEDITKSIPSASLSYPPTDGSSCAEAAGTASPPVAETPPKKPEEPSSPAVITLTLNDKSEYPVTQADIDEWRALFPAVDVLQELRNMKAWCNENPKQRKTRSGAGRFIVAWLTREQNRGGTRPASPQPARKYQTAAEYRAEASNAPPRRDDAALLQKLLDKEKEGNADA